MSHVEDDLSEFYYFYWNFYKKKILFLSVTAKYIYKHMSIC